MRKMEFILKYLPTAQEKHIEWIRLKVIWFLSLNLFEEFV